MPKGYWVTIYRKISDPQKLAAYAELAPKATAPFGGKYLARGTAANAYEAGLKDRIVISEFPSVAQARAAYESDGLQDGAGRAGQRRGAGCEDCRRAGVVQLALSLSACNSLPVILRCEREARASKDGRPQSCNSRAVALRGSAASPPRTSG